LRMPKPAVVAPITGRKRYLLFVGDAHHPVGGFGDFKGAFGTLSAAKIEAAQWIIAYDLKGTAWCHIYDAARDVIIGWNYDNGFDG
jgi:hypothetical protein